MIKISKFQKRGVSLFTAIILFSHNIVSTLVYAEQNPESERRAQIAVKDLEAKGMDEMAVTALSDRMRVELFNTGKFIVLERGQMDEILKEQGFQQSGACSEQACIVEMGQLLGVDKMVAGSVGKLGTLYIVSVRIIDMTTGQISTTKSVECDCPINDLIKAIRNIARLLAGLEAEERIEAKKEVPENVVVAPVQPIAESKRSEEGSVKPKKSGKGTLITVTTLLLGGGGVGAAFALGLFDQIGKKDEPEEVTLEAPPVITK